LAGGYEAFKDILEIYLFLLNLVEDTRDSIRGSRDNKRHWARIHWSFYKKKEPGFSLVGRGFGNRHSPIPIRKPEWNGCAENFHGRIEAEFYEVESFRQGIYF